MEDEKPDVQEVDHEVRFNLRGTMKVPGRCREEARERAVQDVLQPALSSAQLTGVEVEAVANALGDRNVN